MKLTLTQQISQFKKNPSHDPELMCDRIISRGIIDLIQRQPLYGILLAKLNRTNDARLTSPLGLAWLDNKLTLLYSTTRFLNQIDTGKEVYFWLEHEALHIIWLHPARYPKADAITQISTDVAVNQMIPQQVDNEVTLNVINRRWGLHLPANVNSQYYVNQLTRFFGQKAKHQRGSKMMTDQKIKKYLKPRTDDHHFWGNDPHLSHQSKLIQLKRLIKRSYQNTGAKARGTLPGHVRTQIKHVISPPVINWRAYVKMGLGNVPFGQRSSRARFNRRQAYRMDLMGSVSDYIQSVAIFVDNSGSMGDAEISYLLSQLGDFLKHFPVRVTVYSFDTRVHAKGRYQANNRHQIKFLRNGGGGTRFQSIFDYCHLNPKIKPDRLIIILTDGYGDRHLNYYEFNDLLWISTRPKSEFSVKNLRGHLVSLANQKWLKELENE